MPGARFVPRAAERGVPRAHQLASLGTVLCLYRPQHGGELAGWAQAIRVESRTGVDSDGLRESLMFFDAEGRCCWRLYLLPDSDFLAWDRLLDSLPRADEPEVATGVGERLWRRLAGRLLGGEWRSCVLQLHVLPAQTMPPVLGASLAAVSPLGAETARRIAHAEGAGGNLRLDDCCCAQSALVASQVAARIDAGGSHLPLVQSNSGKIA